MKAKILLGLVGMTLLLTGCSSGIGMNGVTTSDVSHTFEKAVVKSSQKVLIKKSKLATLGYAGAGGAVGAGLGNLIGKDTKSTIIGGVVGAGAGALVSAFQEVEAYQVEILSFKQQRFTVFLEENLPISSVVEFVNRGDKEITNINLIELSSENDNIPTQQSYSNNSLLGKRIY